MNILVNNVNVLDHIKKKFFLGGFLVVDKHIVDVYTDTSAIASENIDKIIDAKGMFAIPGFFDIHSRGDLTMISDPSRLSALAQGVVCEVIGNDGFAVAPVRHTNNMVHMQHVSSSLGNPQLKWHWETVSQYLDALHSKIATNIIFYAPHGTLRVDASLNPSLGKIGLTALVGLLERSLDEGASGLSISCKHSPSKDGWKNDEEMMLLATVLKKRDAIMSVCIQGSNAPFKDIERAIYLAKVAGIKLHISRLFSENDNNAEEIIPLLEKGKKDLPGLLVDVSPYSTRLLKLNNIIPEWLKDMSLEELRLKLKKADNVRSLFDSMDISKEWLEKLRLILTSKKELKKYEGSLLEDISMETDRDIYGFLLDLILLDPDKTYFEYDAVDRSILKSALDHAYVLPASTGYLDGRSMPDMFGAVSYYIKNISDADPLKLAIKLASIPADFYRVKWGIKKGHKANLLIFDPKNVDSEADHNNPRSLADGVEQVFVNGKIAFDRNKGTGIRAGEVLNWN